MGIEFDDQRVDVSGVDDRRGRGVGGGVAIGGGAGVVGLIIFVIVTLLGGDPGQLQLPAGQGDQAPGQVQGETAEELQARCNTAGAIEKYTDCRLIKVVNVADDVWADEFKRRGLSFETPRLAFFTGQTTTGCGAASAQVGPFYCPPDQEIFFELGFLEQLQQQFGAQGTFAQGYIAAHEYGHHLQTILGTEPKVRAAQQRDPSNANAYSIALELQADCYAGVWANLADKRAENGINLSEDNIAEAVNAAQAVGDDRIQQKVQGRVDPEGWTHGSAEQRRTWFLTGYRSGDIDSCNTFQ
ncbi:neutral zinc metallopeptidase [Kineosporia sp. A_224]|uniref:KPN_02809 family neutral zinc metallopeptidase n=1 Tax=Kineosporia sp. A_224 TaxID=1962180 RepID=UPI001E3E0F4A|nr:neutral zinc metallopeptidase [Kineosporia sp. A_224]